MVYHYHIPDATFRLAVNLKTEEYRLLFSNASRSICLSIESKFYPNVFNGTFPLIKQTVPSESLQQIARTRNLCFTSEDPCWVAESNLDRTHVYQQRSSSSLTCADAHGMLPAILLAAILPCTNRGIAQQLLILALQSVARGESVQVKQYLSAANYFAEDYGRPYPIIGHRYNELEG